MVAFGVEQKICLSRKHVFTLHAPNEKDAMTSRCLDRKRKYDAPPGECTLLAGPAGILYVFFWRLAGSVAPTGKAIVHWIGCINAIKWTV